MGQLHAFRTSDLDEVWSFIPPNGLQKLRQIAHTTEPANQQHIFFVDGPISVADVWLGTGDGTVKSQNDWRTILIVGEGRGANKVLWSTSASCETGFSNMYNAATGHVHYCGYYALDITNTLGPRIQVDDHALGGRRPLPGRPLEQDHDPPGEDQRKRDVGGLFRGGHQLSVCSGAGCDKRGKGFFVIDMANGNVLWSYTRADNAAMDYAIPAPPALVSDPDGFIQTAYVETWAGTSGASNSARPPTAAPATRRTGPAAASSSGPAARGPSTRPRP